MDLTNIQNFGILMTMNDYESLKQREQRISYSNMEHYDIQPQGKNLYQLEDSVKHEVYFDDITKPKHYVSGVTMEPLDYIMDHEMDFLEGNIIKYVSRYEKKGGVKDLEKAKFYLDKLIEREKKKQ
jgi:hypothetical protein